MFEAERQRQAEEQRRAEKEKADQRAAQKARRLAAEKAAEAKAAEDQAAEAARQAEAKAARAKARQEKADQTAAAEHEKNTKGKARAVSPCSRDPSPVPSDIDNAAAEAAAAQMETWADALAKTRELGMPSWASALSQSLFQLDNDQQQVEARVGAALNRDHDSVSPGLLKTRLAALEYRMEEADEEIVR